MVKRNVLRVLRTMLLISIAARWRRPVLVSIALLAITALLCPPAASDDRDLLVVVNSERTAQKGPGGSVTLLDRDSLERLVEIDIGLRPVWARVIPRGTHLYVLNGGRGWKRTEGSLDVIDLVKRERVASIPLPARPNRVAVPPAGDALFVLSAGFRSHKATLTRIDRRTHEVSGEIELGRALKSNVYSERQHARFSASGHRLFVLREWGEKPARFVVIDLTKWELVHDYELAGGAVPPVATRAGQFLYVLCHGSEELFVFDGETGALVTTIKAGKGAILRSTPDRDHVLLAQTRAGERGATVLALEGGKVVGETPLRWNALQIEWRSTPNEVLVLGDRGIARIDPATWKTTDTVALPIEASWMVVSEDSGRAFVASSKGRNLVVVDLEGSEKNAKKSIELRKPRTASKVAATVVGVIFGLATGLDPGLDGVWDRVAPSVALTPDDRHLIILDREKCVVSVLVAQDSTIGAAVDAKDGCVGIATLGAGAYYLVPSAKYLTVIDGSNPLEIQRHRIGHGAARRLGVWRDDGRDIRLHFDGKRGELWIPIRGSKLAVHDLATGKTVTPVEGLPRPKFLLTWSGRSVKR